MSWAHELTDGWMCEQWLKEQAGSLDAAKKKWKAFQPAGTPPRYSRDRVVDIKHLKLVVKPDFARKTVEGRVELTVCAIADAVAHLELDAVEMTVLSVHCTPASSKNTSQWGRGLIVPFENTGKKLLLTMEPPLKPDYDVTIAIEYRATPRRGLYFVGPDKNDPKKHQEIWSQGQDEDNRHWFPCFDYPNEKASSEMLATVPGNWFALSNGTLLNKSKNADGTATYHWLQEIPHVSYLITLCAGEYVEVKDEWDGIPVNYYVPPGREADGERSFGKTPRMMEHYSKLIGVRYPFAKYAQITAADFIFGGMENTSATTQTDRTLHDARAHLDFSSEPLVSHELVHNWFGNLLTCRDWSHAWLNESFATYFDNLWYRHELGEDEFRYEMYGDLRSYLDEDGGRYRRPIMTTVYREPIDLFDRHLYQKGACVLNMIRNQLGDRLFFKAVKLYTERHFAKTVVTQDLLQAFEDATGKNLDALFDQWIFKGGHPEFEISCAWTPGSDKGGTAALTINQKQTPDELTSIFRLPVKVRFVSAHSDETREFELSEARHTFHVPLPKRPDWIAFDPGNTIPKTLELKLDEDQLRAQLKHDDDVMGRVYAAQALAGKGGAESTEALGEALLEDEFWGVQAECAAGLARLRTPTAFEMLKAAVGLKHPKARRAVARALGAWKTEEAADALQPLVKGDASYFVEAEALESLGKTRAKSAFGILTKAEKRDSWQDVVRRSVLVGLVEADSGKALPLLEERAEVGQPEFARWTALRLMAKAARESGTDADKLRVRRTLEKVLSEGFFFDTMAAIGGLSELRERAAIPALSAYMNSALDARLARQAEGAVEALRGEGGMPPEVKSLRDELEKLKEESSKLKDQVEKLKAQKKEPAKPASKPARPVKATRKKK